MMGDAAGRGHGAAVPPPRRTPHPVPARAKPLLGHAVGSSGGTKILWFLGGNGRNHMTLSMTFA